MRKGYGGGGSNVNTAERNRYKSWEGQQKEIKVTENDIQRTIRERRLYVKWVK